MVFFGSVSLLHQKYDTSMIGETNKYRKYTYAGLCFFFSFFKKIFV